MTTTVTAKSRTLSNGTPNDAGPVESNFVELYNNDQTLATAIDHVIDGTTPFAGEIDFADNIKTDVISESTSGAGVTIDSVLHKDGAIRVPGSAGYTPTTNGDFGYDSTAHTYDVYVNGAAKSLLHTGSSIDDLNDVTITSATSGQVLKHNGTAWVNGSPFEYFESAAQTPSNTAGFTIAHGLSAKPTLAAVILKCTTTDAGYAVGDEVIHLNGGPTNETMGITVWLDATNINARMGSGFYIQHKTTGTATGLDNTKWALYFRAWKF